MTDFNVLIPEMADWNNGAGIDIDGWITGAGDFRLAVGYSRIFWPRFVAYEGMVLREGAFTPKTVSGFMTQCKGDTSSVEAVINHIHLETLHYYAGAGANEERLVYLGRILTDIHKVKLAHEFPDLSFQVVFDDGPQDELIDYQLTFFQSR